MQDSKGYIWFSTEAGLCKFNGRTLKIFDKKNGLPESATYAVYEYENMLWVVTSQNRILVCANDTLHEPLFSKQYTKTLHDDFAITYRLDFIDNSTIYINSKGLTYELDIHTKSLRRHHNGMQFPTDFLFYKTAHKLVPISNRALPKSTNDSLQLVTIVENGKEKKIEIINTIMSYWRVETCRIGDVDFVSCNNKMIRLDKDLNYTIIEYPNRILSIHGDKDNGLWVGIFKDGVYYYPNISDLSSPKHGLDGISISGICQDRENNVWCSSLEKGIFFCHNKNITDYSNRKDLKNTVNLLKNESGKIFASSSTSIFEIDEKVTEHKLNIALSTTVLDVLKHQNNWIIGGQAASFVVNDDFTNLRKIKDDKLLYSSMMAQITKTPDGRTFSVSYGDIKEFKGPSSTYSHRLPQELPWRAILADSKGTIWIGSDGGIHTIDPNNYHIKHIKNTKTVSRIIEDSYGQIWFSTKGSGLYLMTDTAVHHVNSLLNIPTDIFYDITEDKNKCIWAGTNIGLIKIEKQGAGYKTSIYTTKHGLASNVIHKVASNDKEIFISSAEGLSSFPLNVNLQNTIPPTIYTSTMTVNGNSINAAAKSYLFPYDYNSINVSFDILTYKDLGGGKLLYKLNGRDKDFQLLTGNTIIMDNLPPDKYRLEVYALNSDGIKSEKPVIISIEIEQPFWETAWFIILSVVTFCVLFYFSAKKAIDNIRKKEAAKTHINKMMAEYQLSALQAQMNPHFIFNAINSIQSYILRKDEQQAYDYLSKFSKLIRMVLNNSEEKILTLHQELETLDLYIQLEQLRFNNKFEYQLHISDEVDPHEVQVPAMLIQPYVENAIWHGLMNLDDMRKGILRIEITHIGDELKIIVEDNGVGRDFTKQELKKRTHKSIGMQLGEKRLMMLNQLKDFENARVQIVDLFDEAGHASGTRIEIYLPFN